MIRRIFGLETEYGVARLGAASRWSSRQAVRELFRGRDFGSQSATFLGNGGRLYVDVGDHPEYATAECDKLRDLLAQDRGGDFLLNQMLCQLSERSDNPLAHLRLFRNNFDAQNNSFGCHENYLISRSSQVYRYGAFFTFLISRVILTGAGRIDLGFSEGDSAGTALNQVGQRYWVGARASSMNSLFSSHSTNNRPIVNTRDQPLADPQRFRRLHVMVGDTNVSEYATALKVGCTLLVLSALELVGDWEDLKLDDPIAALKLFGQDVDLQARVRLADGRKLSAAEIQAEFIDRVDRSGVVDDFNDDLIPVVWQSWKELVEAARTKDFSSLSSRVDWVLKLELLEKFCARENISLFSERARLLEWEYHCVSGSLRSRLEACGSLRRLTDSSQVHNAVHSPPQTTRAYARGRLIACARSLRRDFYADWSVVRIGSNREDSITLDDPFSAKTAEITRLIAELETVG